MKKKKRKKKRPTTLFIFLLYQRYFIFSRTFLSRTAISAARILRLFLFNHHATPIVPVFLFFFFPHSQLSSCSLLMSGVPAVYYHGTGSENASRAYTETPMQHVQRTALRKKCMRSTFTLDCGKKKRERQKRTRLLSLFSLSLLSALVFAILFHAHLYSTSLPSFKKF